MYQDVDNWKLAGIFSSFPRNGSFSLQDLVVLKKDMADCFILVCQGKTRAQLRIISLQRMKQRISCGQQSQNQAGAEI